MKWKLDAIFENSSPSFSTVSIYVLEFKRDCMHTNNDPCSGRSKRLEIVGKIYNGFDRSPNKNKRKPWASLMNK